MTDLTWHSGPPPHVGWWHASYARNPDTWRWWNGAYWSLSVASTDSLVVVVVVVKLSRIPSRVEDSIEWTDYWPENARVPRVKP